MVLEDHAAVIRVHHNAVHIPAQHFVSRGSRSFLVTSAGDTPRLHGDVVHDTLYARQITHHGIWLRLSDTSNRPRPPG